MSGAVSSQAKDCLEPPGAGRRCSWSLQGGCDLAHNLISDLMIPQTVQEQISVV